MQAGPDRNDARRAPTKFFFQFSAHLGALTCLILPVELVWLNLVGSHMNEMYSTCGGIIVRLQGSRSRARDPAVTYQDIRDKPFEANRPPYEPLRVGQARAATGPH